MKNDHLDELLKRGVENIYPNKAFLEEKLVSGEKITLYLGLDPTGPTLHMGHAIPLMKLRQFQKLGHKIILLIGDFTAMIGDPTDKTATRKKLTHVEVLENAKLYQKQASLFLDFDGANKAELKYNAEWLAKMTFADVVELSSHFTVQQMLERDMFEKRLEEKKPVYVHEFLYPLMQGYDSVAMDVDGEIGGNDQTFNMLAGRTLMKQIKNKEKFVLSLKLLADSSGKKMGKTEGNMLSFLDSAEDMFGKVMSWTDGMILPGFELCTTVSYEEIPKIEKELAGGKNPKEIKMRLAKEIVMLFYGDEKAELSEKNFNETFVKGGVSKDAVEVEAHAGEKLADVVVRSKTVPSKTEFRRLINDGAISIVGGEKIEDVNFLVEKNLELKIGKHRFLKIILS